MDGDRVVLQNRFEDNGILERVTLFLNLTNDSRVG